jgi:hypothetical protein
MKQTLGPRIFGGVDNEAGLGWTWGRRRRGVAGSAEAWAELWGWEKIWPALRLPACLPGVIET